MEQIELEYAARFTQMEEDLRNTTAINAKEIREVKAENELAWAHVATAVLVDSQANLHDLFRDVFQKRWYIGFLAIWLPDGVSNGQWCETSLAPP